jgi:hypothetical protein
VGSCASLNPLFRVDVGDDTDPADELAIASGNDTDLAEESAIFVGVDTDFSGLSEDFMGTGRCAAL